MIRNKRAFAEVFSWMTALIAVFVIVGVSLTLYTIFGKKIGTNEEFIKGSSWDNLENLRMTEFFINEPITKNGKDSFGLVNLYVYGYEKNSGNKFEELEKIFESFQKDFEFNESRIAVSQYLNYVYLPCQSNDPKDKANFVNPINFMSSYVFWNNQSEYLYGVVYLPTKYSNKKELISFLILEDGGECK
jgi:hypothetical protein